MRKLGLVTIAALLSLVACAQDPNRETGAAGSTGTGGGGGGGSGGGSSYTPPALKLAHPNLIISRGAQVFAMPNANGNAAVNGSYHNGGWGAGRPTAAAPAWIAIKLAAGPTRILVSWDDGGTYNYQDPPGTTVYGLAADYYFETSSDSTNGSDGTWAMAGSPITGNAVRTRAQAIDFAGKTWVKMVITAPPPNASGNGVQIGEIDVHDISSTGAGLPEDTWFFMGDSISAFAYDRRAANQPSFAAAINTATGMTYMPAMINGGIGGENTTGALARLDQVLANNPDYRFFAITYGTNDGWGNSNTATFRSNLQMMIDKIKAAGRVPVLSRVPFSPDGNHGSLPMFNAVIDELTQTNQLQIGPDFYAHFMAHTDQLSDMVHPTADGQKEMNRLWAEAMRVVYP
jgi:lysophospholipase L1-like esterase